VRFQSPSMSSQEHNNHHHHHHHNHKKMRQCQGKESRIVIMVFTWSEEKGEELRIARMMFMRRTNSAMRKKENIRKK